jgi:endonuclease G, mitochondrial
MKNILTIFITIIFSFSALSVSGQDKDTVNIVNYKYFTIGYTKQGTNWCAYRLTSDMVKKDTTRNRPSFKTFNSIKTSDYTNTGYDRGHLAPADSFSFDLEGYNETFFLSNIVPMKPKLNRQVWKWLEVYEKRLVEELGCLYVVIKVGYGDEKVRRLSIPTYFTRVVRTCDGEVIAEYEFKNL